MDQIILVAIGSFAVVCHVLSPVTLMERITILLEKYGKVSTPNPADGTQKVRKYYVHGIK